MRSPMPPTLNDVIRIYNILDNAYRPTLLGNKSNPLDELVYVMLSGQTSEARYQQVYTHFKRRFRSWESVADAPRHEIEKTIWHVGLASQKSQYIKDIALRLRADFGKVSLKHLKEMDDDTAEAYLMSLPGIGVKIARCVLMYSLDRCVFPADVHCLRVMSRLNWIESTDRSSKIVADQAQACIPPELRKLFHIRLVQHGRKVCRPVPICSDCCISNECYLPDHQVPRIEQAIHESCHDCS